MASLHKEPHHRNAIATKQGRTSATRCNSLHQEAAVAQAQLGDLCDFLRPSDIPSNVDGRARLHGENPQS
jgi:hypothetical protein